MSKRLFKIVGVFFIFVFLGACSSGGETGTGQNDPVVSVGVITGFGSVFVNGVKFETNSNTSVSVDGDANALESQLAVGMIVTISGSVNADGVSGKASGIIFEDNVEGLVIDNSLATGGVLNVMGQIIVVDNETVFRSNVSTINIIDDVAVNQVIEVSGYTNGDGNIYATRIELKRGAFTSGENIEVKGVVKSVTVSTFAIGSMTVTYRSDLLKGFETSLKSGDFVSVKSTTGFNSNNELIASAIELKETSRIEKILEVDKEIEFEGIVSQFDATAKTFTLNSVSIALSDITEYEDGAFIDLKDRVKVKIHGALNANGVVVANAVKIKTVSNTLYEGSVEAVNMAEGSITLLGVKVLLNNSTRFIDDMDNNENMTPDYDRQYFNFSRISVGDNVQVRVFTDSTGALVASKLERRNKETETEANGLTGIERELEGIVSNYNVSANTMTVSGVDINIQNTSISGTLVNGVMVEVTGMDTMSGWFAIEVSVANTTGDKAESESESESDVSSES